MGDASRSSVQEIDAHLQLLENELLSISKKDLSIAQYFHRVKTLSREIAKLDQQSLIDDARMKHIIIHGLRVEYRNFVVAVQGKPTQPSSGELENLLESQEALAKQLSGLLISSTSTTNTEDESLYVERGKSKSKSGNNQRGANRYGYKNKYHNHGEKKTGHFARSCRVEQNDEGNAATVENEDGRDMEAYVAQTEDVVAFTSTSENRLYEWIVDSGALNHLSKDKEQMQHLSMCGGNRVVVIADNSKHPIAHTRDDAFFTGSNKRELALKRSLPFAGGKEKFDICTTTD
ncbi:uncharacterized protein LOC143634067 [Bidens hawaiensis]|uniref:uncharacterized protein LOC143634067 n=1 Tax=Bidens hawaiensis TaxID=980011 RepID=UPI00404B3AE1